jgi:radical SAM protein with 4Fe4S-binding SPASM domain
VLAAPPDDAIIIDKLSALILFLCDGTNSQQDIILAVESHLGSKLPEGFEKKFFNKYRNYLSYREERNVYKKFSSREFDLLFSGDKYIPYALTIIPSEACNIRCNYCIRNDMDKRQHWSKSTFDKFLEEAIELSISRLSITGGEPLLLPNIADFINLCTSNNIFTMLSTNAFIEDSNVIDDIINSGISELQVSLDTVSNSTFRNMTERSGLHVIYSNLEKFVESGIEVSIRTVLTDMNFQEMKTLIEYTKSLGIKKHRVTTDSNVTSNFLPENHELREQYIGFARDVESLGEPHVEAPSGGKWPKGNYGGACPGLTSSPVIFPNGNVSICELTPDMVIGSFKKEKLIDIYNSVEADIIRKKAMTGNVPDRKCTTCEHLSQCATGCFVYKDVNKLDLFEADPRCSN